MQHLSQQLSIQQFAGIQSVGFVLVLCRVGGLFVLAPIFSGKMIPSQAKLIIAGAISFTLEPLVTHGTKIPTGLAVVPLMIKELIVGLAFALALGAIGAAVQFAASLLDTMIGFSMAALIDPMSSAPAAILGQFYSLFSVLVFLMIGGDQLMIEGLAASYRLIPVGQMPSIAQLGTLATSDLASIAVVGLEIGAPVVIALTLVDVAFALMARTVPQMNVFVVGMPAKILVGFAAIGASLAFVTGDLEGLLQQGVMTTLNALKVH
ncbi:MAG TPA: flagellar biosynthetic protein FliR [Gaiellaceae bacterium]